MWHWQNYSIWLTWRGSWFGWLSHWHVFRGCIHSTSLIQLVLLFGILFFRNKSCVVWHIDAVQWILVSPLRRLEIMSQLGDSNSSERASEQSTRTLWIIIGYDRERVAAQASSMFQLAAARWPQTSFALETRVNEPCWIFGEVAGREDRCAWGMRHKARLWTLVVVTGCQEQAGRGFAEMLSAKAESRVAIGCGSMSLGERNC